MFLKVTPFISYSSNAIIKFFLSIDKLPPNAVSLLTVWQRCSKLPDAACVYGVWQGLSIWHRATDTARFQWGFRICITLPVNKRFPYNFYRTKWFSSLYQNESSSFDWLFYLFKRDSAKTFMNARQICRYEGFKENQ